MHYDSRGNLRWRVIEPEVSRNAEIQAPSYKRRSDVLLIHIEYNASPIELVPNTSPMKIVAVQEYIKITAS